MGDTDQWKRWIEQSGTERTRLPLTSAPQTSASRTATAAAATARPVPVLHRPVVRSVGSTQPWTDRPVPVSAPEMRFPSDRRYSRNHMWVAPTTGEIGITDALARLLLIVTAIDWLVDEASVVEPGDPMLRLTARRREDFRAAVQLTLVAPVTGLLLERNPKLTRHAILKFREDPFALLHSPYDEGWLARLSIAEGAADALMDATSYRTYVAGLLET